MVGIGVDGVTILGVLGESNRLHDEERHTLIESAVTVIGRRVPIIVGTSATGTRTAVYLSRMAQELGADAVMVTPSREAVPNEDRIFELYQRIGESLSIPIVLQDHPASTDVHMSVNLMTRILRGVARRVRQGRSGADGPKIRQLRSAFTDRPITILSGLGGPTRRSTEAARRRQHRVRVSEVCRRRRRCPRRRLGARPPDYSRFAPLIVRAAAASPSAKKYRRRGLLSRGSGTRRPASRRINRRSSTRCGTRCPASTSPGRSRPIRLAGHASADSATASLKGALPMNAAVEMSVPRTTSPHARAGTSSAG
jgi:4-hydroxy-tetrahydrodipicolinate synthase